MQFYGLMQDSTLCRDERVAYAEISVPSWCHPNIPSLTLAAFGRCEKRRSSFTGCIHCKDLRQDGGDGVLVSEGLKRLGV